MAIARPASTVMTHTPGAPADTPSDGVGDTAAAGATRSLVAPSGHIRRCTFRRVTALSAGRRQLPMYDVECLHPTYDSPLALGSLEAARATCTACTLPGVFRPDED